MPLYTRAVSPDETLRSADTLQPRQSWHAAAHEVTAPILTVACHPDLRRVGERAVLAPLLLRETVGLSRLEPAFAGRPLEDRFVSRRPVVLSAAGDGGVSLDASGSGTKLRVDGARVEGTHVVSAADLRRGVVLELAGSTVLVLHAGRTQQRHTEDLGLVGVSDAMADVRRQILQAGPEDVAVLLRGESGTGKELVAQALHAASPRRGRTLVAVNAAAIPSSTAASELFGHEKGAFTGATQTHRGYFGAADAGTLFLDEVGEVPDAMQPMLLRALEAGEIQPVGGRHARRVDVRLIAATDADLDQAVEEGVFRRALLHRLSGFTIAVPPLRARRDDISVLLLHFLRAELDSERLDDPGPDGEPWLRASLVARLVRYDWPGNVRQLRNVARQLVIAGRDEPVASLGPSAETLMPAAPRAPVSLTVGAPKTASRTHLDTITDEALLSALRDNGWRIASSARTLGVSKNSLYRLMERCPSIRKAGDLTRAEILASAAELHGDVTQMAARLEVSKRGLLLRMRELDLSHTG